MKHALKFRKLQQKSIFKHFTKILKKPSNSSLSQYYFSSKITSQYDKEIFNHDLCINIIYTDFEMSNIIER